MRFLLSVEFTTTSRRATTITTLDPPNTILGSVVTFATVAEMFLCVSKIFERVFVMKKFSIVAIFFFCLMFNVSASAQAVQIYDEKVKKIINALNNVPMPKPLLVRKAEYYTYQGAKRCEMHFGRTGEPLIRFRLNNDNSVSRFLVTFSMTQLVAIDSEVVDECVGLLLVSIGMTRSEINNLLKKASNGFNGAHGNNFHEKYSVWCSVIQRYVVLDMEANSSKIDYYFYAHD